MRSRKGGPRLKGPTRNPRDKLLRRCQPRKQRGPKVNVFRRAAAMGRAKMARMNRMILITHWKSFFTGMAARIRFATVLVFVVLGSALGADGTDRDDGLAAKLGDFDRYVEKLLKDWNAPGVAIGVVKGDALVFARGYGYRDYEARLPFTARTLCPIASNTKLFT